MNSMKPYVIFFLLLVSSPALSQSFEKKYGGTSYDRGTCLALPAGGGYVLAGESSSFNQQGKDIMIVRTDNNGNVQWAKTYAGSADEMIYEILAVSDGYVVCGQTQSFGAGGIDMYVFKVDTAGNLLWANTFGGTSDDGGISIRQTSDAGYIAIGYTRSFGPNVNTNCYMVKMDSTGILQWSRSFGFTSNDWPVSVIQTPDGGYAMTGYANGVGAGMDDLFVAKTDPSGNITWMNSYGGTANDAGGSIRSTSDGGYVIAGNTRSFGAHSPTEDVWLLKLDSSGNVDWTKTFAATGNDIGNSVEQTSDGGYVCLGYSNSYTSGFAIFIVKTDSSGNLQWSRHTADASPSKHYNLSRSVAQLNNSEFLVVGSADDNGAGSEDFYALRMNAQDQCMIAVTPQVSSMEVLPNPITPVVYTPTASVAVNPAVATVAPVTTVNCNSVGIEEQQTSFNIYPNPAIDEIFIEFTGEARIELINSMGQVIVRKEDQYINNTAIDLKGMAKGLYFLRLTSGNRSSAKPIVLE